MYTSRFDPAYWKDRYEHSQWKLPQSQRGIGDEGLYLHEGYVLVNGADPTLYNAEVPPLGKYAIGASILLFGNGYLFGILATTAALVAFFFLAKSVLPKSLALATTLLVAMDPLVTSQFAATMLESLQLLFFLVTCLLVLSLLKQKSVLKIPAFILAIDAGFGAFFCSQISPSVTRHWLLYSRNYLAKNKTRSTDTAVSGSFFHYLSYPLSSLFSSRSHHH